MREEQDLGVEIVLGWFTHGDDFILSTFLVNLCKRTYKATNKFLAKLMNESHDLQGCARA